MVVARYQHRHTESSASSCHLGAVRRPGCDILRSRADILDEDTFRSSNLSSSTMTDDSNAFSSKYRNLKSIRKGRVVTVLRAVDHKLRSSVIVKLYQKDKLTARWRDQHTREHKMLMLVQGTAGVAQLLTAFEDDAGLYLVQAACTGSTLIEAMSNQVGRFSEHACALDVVLPLLRVLCRLHERGIVHRSLRPEHVVCSPGNVTLIDFSVAVDRAQHCLNSRAGSVEYMAPEVLTKPADEDVFHKVLYCGMSEEELPSYDEKADVWSLGVLIYEVLTGVQPFFADTVPDMITLQALAFSRHTPDSPYPDFIAKQGLSPHAQHFLALALQLDPTERASTAELLAHAWVQPETFRDVVAPRRSLSCNDAGSQLRSLSLSCADPAAPETVC
ncbi:MAG: hypothetical protein WDW36_004699 [Sanguina aurantia]